MRNGEQIQHASVACLKGWNLCVDMLRIELSKAALSVRERAYVGTQ